MIRPQIPTSNFKTESWHYAVTRQLVTEFWCNSDVDEIVSKNIRMDCKLSELQVFEVVKTLFNQQFGTVKGNFIHFNQFYAQAGNRFLMLAKGDQYRNRTNSGINEISMDVYGSMQDVLRFEQAVDAKIRDHKLVKISWHYKTANGTDSASLHVTGLNQTLKDEYYPWLAQGVDQFIHSYMNSTASVLVMYGPPGTGKTSFLRHLLLTQKVNAIITYDERVLRDDEFFVNYLTDDEHNALIVEDADLFLASREDSSNDMMSKFLNVSDGLIKITNKKLIFTTNISQINRIDPALMRPGRCFAAVEFRELHPAEAQNAATAAGMPQRDWHSQSRWSLAQIWGEEQDASECNTTKFKIGFG
jgi:hypothetical protein